MLLNCDDEKTLESPLDCKEVKPVNPKGNERWIFIGRTNAEAEAPILWPPDAKSWLWKRPWCWERLKAGGEGDDRGWDGWMASPTQWTWVWVNSGYFWWTGRPGLLQSMGLQKVRQDWATELNWFKWVYLSFSPPFSTSSPPFSLPSILPSFLPWLACTAATPFTILKD